ncbi:VPLPA-CTERM sorting domain-containing protein [Planctomycetota bacterium]|nr:VPLPA-CTERM sorting domain-containing protein [Planctomycetota bacterium]
MNKIASEQQMRLFSYAAAAIVTLLSIITSPIQAALVTADDVAIDSGSQYFSALNLTNTSGLTLGSDNTLTADDFYTNSFNYVDSWVTNTVSGGDYFNVESSPILTFTFDNAVDIDQVAIWGYVGFDDTRGVGNSASQGFIEFSTDGVNFGPAIAFSIDPTQVGEGATVTDFDLQHDIVAARVTFTDNHANLDGGDRVGANLVAFNTVIVPTPSAMWLIMFGLAGLVVMRNRRKLAYARVR